MLTGGEIDHLWSAESRAQRRPRRVTSDPGPVPVRGPELVDAWAAETAAARMVAARRPVRPGAVRACLLLLPGAPTDKQERAVVGYALDHAYRATSLTNLAAVALDLARAELVEVVVAAFHPTGQGAAAVVAAIRTCGCRFEVVRENVRRRARLEIAEVVRGMFERGADVETIGHLLDLPAGVVVEHLRAGGLS